jgi:hypothetical protein
MSTYNCPSLGGRCGASCNDANCYAYREFVRYMSFHNELQTTVTNAKAEEKKEEERKS